MFKELFLASFPKQLHVILINQFLKHFLSLFPIRVRQRDAILTITHFLGPLASFPAYARQSKVQILMTQFLSPHFMAYFSHKQYLITHSSKSLSGSLFLPT